MPTIYEPVLILRPENLTIAEDARIDSFTKLECGEGMIVGRGVHIASFCHIGIGGGVVEIGDYAACASGAKILSGSNRPEGLSMSASAPAEMQVVTRERTVLEPYAFVGTNAVIMPGVTVGEGAVVGAGSVVTHDVPAWEIWAGVPARRMRYRLRERRPGWKPVLDCRIDIRGARYWRVMDGVKTTADFGHPALAMEAWERG